MVVFLLVRFDAYESAFHLMFLLVSRVNKRRSDFTYKLQKGKSVDSALVKRIKSKAKQQQPDRVERETIKRVNSKSPAAVIRHPPAPQRL